MLCSQRQKTKKQKNKKNQQQSLKGASENKWTSTIRKIDKRYLWGVSKVTEPQQRRI